MPSASPPTAAEIKAEIKAEKKWVKEMKNTVNLRGKVFPLSAKPGRDHISMKYNSFGGTPGKGEGLPTPSYMNKLIRSGLEFSVRDDNYHGNHYLGALRWNDVRGGTWSPTMIQTQDPKYADGYMVTGWRSIN